MEATLKRIVQYWMIVYCDSLVHSLVVVDKIQDTAIIVYSYNELTQILSG